MKAKRKERKEKRAEARHHRKPRHKKSKMEHRISPEKFGIYY
jgi:hypothetical protein